MVGSFSIEEYMKKFKLIGYVFLLLLCCTKTKAQETDTITFRSEETERSRVKISLSGNYYLPIQYGPEKKADIRYGYGYGVGLMVFLLKELDLELSISESKIKAEQNPKEYSADCAMFLPRTNDRNSVFLYSGNDGNGEAVI